MVIIKILFSLSDSIIIIIFNIISRTHGMLHNLAVNYSVMMRKINACNNQCNCSAKERFNGWYRSDK